MVSTGYTGLGTETVVVAEIPSDVVDSYFAQLTARQYQFYPWPRRDDDVFATREWLENFKSDVGPPARSLGIDLEGTLEEIRTGTIAMGFGPGLYGEGVRTWVIADLGKAERVTVIAFTFG